MKKTTQVDYTLLTPEYFQQVMDLANKVHGDGYAVNNDISNWVTKGIKNNINSCFIALDGNKVIGFRITYAAQQWEIDEWSTPKLWRIPQDKCCYFKCNTIDISYRGLGIGKKLLLLSIDAVKRQGATAGVAHLWGQSPDNSAVAYFTKCGGELIKVHIDKWLEDSKNGYNCTICGYDCHCDAVEMIIHFD